MPVTDIILDTPDVIVPQSLVRQLADPDPDTFFRLFSVWQVTVAFALLGLVDRRHPEREVTVRPRDIIRVIKAARLIERHLRQVQGKEQTSPRAIPAKDFAALNEALVTLFRVEFAINMRVPAPKAGKNHDARHELRICHAHFLDSFSFCYTDATGDTLNLDLLPDSQKRNVSDDKRPVLRLSDGRRPVAVAFRVNSELAREVTRRGSRTFFVSDVFGLLQRLAQDPGAVRTALWLIGNRDLVTKTNKGWLYHHLIASGSHRSPADQERRVDDVLNRLTAEGVITSIETCEYAAASRKPGQTYLNLTKSEKWHVTRALGGPVGTPSGTNSNARGRADTGEAALSLRERKDRRHNPAQMSFGFRGIEGCISLPGIHNIPSGDTQHPFRGYTPPCPGPSKAPSRTTHRITRTGSPESTPPSEEVSRHG